MQLDRCQVVLVNDCTLDGRAYNWCIQENATTFFPTSESANPLACEARFIEAAGRDAGRFGEQRESRECVSKTGRCRGVQETRKRASNRCDTITTDNRGPPPRGEGGGDTLTRSIGTWIVFEELDDRGQ